MTSCSARGSRCSTDLWALRGGDAVARMPLATALAAVGRFEDAVALGESAVMLAREAGNNQLEAEIAARLVKFQDGSPWQMPLPTAAP